MGMEEAAASNFSTLLVALLIFLFVTQIEARTLERQMCSSSCGDIKNISYPFHLNGDPAGCGHPDYGLSCQRNQTILEVYSGKYYVKKILYEEHIISVVDVNFANGSCGISYDYNSVDDFYSYYRGARITQFLKCSNNITDPDYTEFPCLSGNYVYFSDPYYYDTISKFPESCEIISRVIINEDFMKEWRNRSYQVIRESLQSGLNLTWIDGERDCISAGGLCRPYPENFSCDCQNHRYPILEILGKISSLFIPRFLVALQSLLGFLILLLISSSLSLTQIYGTLIMFLIVRFILFVVLIVFIIRKYIKTRKTVDIVEKFLHKQKSWVPKRYSYIEIMALTNHFRDKLGQGGFGSVYKGQLFDGCLIAVKVLENSKFSGEEFISEVSTIGRIHHANVVRLLGFCSEGSKRALVYEYMPNGSLDRHIFSNKGNGQTFNWEKLQQIASGIARGIEYLHNGCDVCILHFDIKPHNILLDRNFIPKIADFGLAKFYPKENDFICVSATRGTIGYIAPELISRNFGIVSCKSDVYSFGMLLLEMAGGRRNSFARATHSSKAYFPSWVYDQMIKGRDLELRNMNEIEGVIARKLCIIGLWCIQVKATDRPSITKVVEMLEGSIDDLQMPPKPFFAAASSSSSQKTCIREIQSDSSTESTGECSYSDAYDV